jgi:hypothetical protein
MKKHKFRIAGLNLIRVNFEEEQFIYLDRTACDALTDR